MISDKAENTSGIDCVRLGGGFGISAQFFEEGTSNLLCEATVYVFGGGSTISLPGPISFGGDDYEEKKELFLKAITAAENWIAVELEKVSNMSLEEREQYEKGPSDKAYTEARRMDYAKENDILREKIAIMARKSEEMQKLLTPEQAISLKKALDSYVGELIAPLVKRRDATPIRSSERRDSESRIVWRKKDLMDILGTS